jgi:hypothetical protein
MRRDNGKIGEINQITSSPLYIHARLVTSVQFAHFAGRERCLGGRFSLDGVPLVRSLPIDGLSATSQLGLVSPDTNHDEDSGRESERVREERDVWGTEISRSFKTNNLKSLSL